MANILLNVTNQEYIEQVPYRQDQDTLLLIERFLKGVDDDIINISLAFIYENVNLISYCT